MHGMVYIIVRLCTNLKRKQPEKHLKSYNYKNFRGFLRKCRKLSCLYFKRLLYYSRVLMKSAYEINFFITFGKIKRNSWCNNSISDTTWSFNFLRILYLGNSKTHGKMLLLLPLEHMDQNGFVFCFSIRDSCLYFKRLFYHSDVLIKSANEAGFL